MDLKDKNNIKNEQPKNYYDVIIQKIKVKIKDNPKEALFLMEKELSTPYIPKEYEEIFKKLFLKTIDGYEKNRKNVKLNPIECLEILQAKKQTLKPLALAELRNYDLRPFILEISKIFKNIDIEVQIKASIYEFLCEQEIDFNFNISNKILNPVKNKSLVNNDFYINNRKKIEKRTFKEISIKNIAFEILNSYCASKFPESILLNDLDYSDEFIWIAKKMLGIAKDEEKTSLCDKIYKEIFTKKIDKK